MRVMWANLTLLWGREVVLIEGIRYVIHNWNTYPKWNAQKYTTPNECHEQISPLYGSGGVRGGLLMVLWALAAYFFVNWPWYLFHFVHGFGAFLVGGLGHFSFVLKFRRVIKTLVDYIECISPLHDILTNSLNCSSSTNKITAPTTRGAWNKYQTWPHNHGIR